MDSDEEDFVFYGTSIEREEENISRKKKAEAESSGQLRTVVPWKQEVRDEEGRRRFHGAFTGGYSAGYYNTVGSKEGWTPQSFVSSRKNRAELKQQSIFNFLDEDEKADLEGNSLGTSSQFDTFGFTAAEIARKQAEKEQKQRPSAIPGPAPDELVLPAADSIGMKLLLKMGWRRGRSIKDFNVNSAYDARREARKAFLAFSSDELKAHHANSGPTQSDPECVELPASDDVQSSKSTNVFLVNPKGDLYGLGFDPYKHAPEFREKKRSRLSDNREPQCSKALSMRENLFGFNSGKVAPGFGIGALEELNAEDEDVYGSGYDFEETYVHEIEEPSKLNFDSERGLAVKKPGILPGFRPASNSDYQLERFDPPLVPKDFVPHHKFVGLLETGYDIADPSPPEVSPPEDNNLKLLIEGVATLVARCGKLFEDLSREKNKSNPLFSFLVGGNGHGYYMMKLWEARQKQGDKTKKKLDGKLSPSKQKMNAESRGKILGERPLEQSSKDSHLSVAVSDSINVPYSLSDTFTKPASYSELVQITRPFKDDPAKQERFEMFLKEKYQGGLRSTESGRASNMSESSRALERLDFEAAAQSIEKGKWTNEDKLPFQHISESFATGGAQFTSGGLEQFKDGQVEELSTKKMYPKREEYQWRPSPLLCKRFDLIDPYMGKPPPAPRMRSKMESAFFIPDIVKATSMEEMVIANSSFLHPHADNTGVSKDIADKEIEIAEVENVERPVDLYKAIFSDDSDDEEDVSGPSKVEHPEKKVEAANKTLSRLVAGDFLESLGRELGLEVPPDPLQSMNRTPLSQKETNGTDPGNDITVPVETRASFSDVYSESPIINGVTHGPDIAQDGRYHKNELKSSSFPESSGKQVETGSSDKFRGERKAKTSGNRHHSSSSSTSEDERRKKRNRQLQDPSSDSNIISSTDEQGHYHSRLKGRDKESSREESRSRRKHSNHCKRKNKHSPTRSHRHKDREHAEAKREKHRKRN